ncbi:MAG: hypothetical protein LBM62_00995 [Mediterranea sp.]|nr:hypothetical protein [Mediterranea sp.]
MCGKAIQNQQRPPRHEEINRQGTVAKQWYATAEKTGVSNNDADNKRHQKPQKRITTQATDSQNEA